jgi:plasmid stability protein
MPTLTLKALPAPLHRRLKARATRHKRSLNQEVISMLEEAVTPARRPNAEELVAEARSFRASLGFTATPQEIERYKRAGRR